MAKKKPSIVIEDIFKEKDRELSDDLFDITTSKGMINIPIGKISANPDQPRKTFNEETITELADSIKEHGVLNPIIVRPSGKKYEIIAGERRYRAAVLNGLKEIPAIIKKVTDDDAKIISLIENIQREDLNDVDRAAALRELKVNLGLPWNEIGRRLGLTKSRILDLVGLLSLPDEIQDDIRHRKLTEKHGRALRQIADQEDKLPEVVTFIKENKLTGDQSIGLIRAIKGQPGLTIEENFKTINTELPKPKIVKKEPLEEVISEAEKLIKNLGEIKLVDLNKENKKTLQSKLLEVKKKINNIIKTIES